MFPFACLKTQSVRKRNLFSDHITSDTFFPERARESGVCESLRQPRRAPVSEGRLHHPLSIYSRFHPQTERALVWFGSRVPPGPRAKGFSTPWPRAGVASLTWPIKTSVAGPDASVTPTGPSAKRCLSVRLYAVTFPGMSLGLHL